MNCFVIMPFGPDFDNVYAAIKASCQESTSGTSLTCRRLDEISRPGRISEDLIREITDAAFCIVDITGSNPNVMWECGYAMALEKPIVFISQNVDTLPFDIKDMRTIKYDRRSLSGTLNSRLADAIQYASNELTQFPQEHGRTWGYAASRHEIAGDYRILGSNDTLSICHIADNHYRLECFSQWWRGEGIFDGRKYFGYFIFTEDAPHEGKGHWGTHLAKFHGNKFNVFGKDMVSRIDYPRSTWQRTA